MAEKQKKMRLSFFKRLLLLMIIVNIPLLLSIFVFCYHSMRVIREDTVKTVRDNQQNIVNIVENDVKYVEQQLYHISNMDDWNVLRETSREVITYDGIYALNQFRSRFQNILGTSRLFTDIWANIETANLRFSVNDGIGDFDKEEYDALIASAEEYVRFRNKEGKLYITSQNGWKQDISISTVAELDIEKIRNMIDGDRSFLSEQIILVFHTATEPVYVCAGVSEEVYRAVAETESLPEEGKNFMRHMLLVHTSSAMGDFDIYSFIAENDIYDAMQEFYTRLFAILAGSVLVVLSYAVIVSKMLQKPVRILLDGFQKVEKGDFSVRLNRDREDEFAVLYQGFNRMNEKVAELIDENYVKELYAQRAVYRQLQSQINPHFLYNSFFVLQNMIQDEDNENAMEFAGNLSRYYKFITKTEREEVFLEEETEHARTYLEIMKKRYGHRLEFEILCGDPSCLKLVVPRLILQPFIENVFLYGYRTGSKIIEIRIHIFRENENILVVIEDNGAGMEKLRLQELSEKLSQGGEMTDSAIFNINKRLRIKFGLRYGVFLENNSEKGGCRVCLRLPGNVD